MKYDNFNVAKAVKGQPGPDDLKWISDKGQTIVMRGGEYFAIDGMNWNKLTPGESAVLAKRIAETTPKK